MTTLAAGAGILGAMGSIFGGLMGASGGASAAKAQIQAGRDAQKLYDDKTAEGMARIAVQLYGAGALPFLKQQLPRDQFDRIIGRDATNANFTEEQQRTVDELNRKLALPTRSTAGGIRGNTINAAQGRETYTQDQKDAFKAQLDALTEAAGGRTGITGVLNRGEIEGVQGGGIFGQMQGLADSQRAEGDTILSGYNDDTYRQKLMGEGLEKQARLFGKQEAQRIKRDSERQLAGLNRRTQGNLIASGLGKGTIATQAMTGNTQRMQEGTEDALGRLGDRQIGLLTGIGQANMGNMAQRAGGKTTLQSALLDRNLGLQSAPLQAQYGLMTSNIFNPWVGQNTTQYFPGVSPSGQFASTIGNSMSAFGGGLTRYGMEGLNNGGGGGSTQPGQYNVDWSYQPGSTSQGSNRPR